ncbi:MAG TPA: hypothetical protein VKF35_11735 [Hyphomicrobiaceae bacterium]|nr:hypothetical protein [Hyphomicrobiaceae bacterium]
MMTESKGAAKTLGTESMPRHATAMPVASAAAMPVTTATTTPTTATVSGFRRDSCCHHRRRDKARQQRSLFLDCHATTSMVPSVILGGQRGVCHAGGQSSFQKIATNAIQFGKTQIVPRFPEPCRETT